MTKLLVVKDGDTTAPIGPITDYIVQLAGSPDAAAAKVLLELDLLRAPISEDQQAALDGKAPIDHEQEISTVTGLQDALDGKAPVDHEQEISTVTGLQDALDGKAPVDHEQEISTVTGLQDALDGKAPALGLAAATAAGRANAAAIQMGALSVTASLADTTWTLSWSGLRLQIDNIAVSVENQSATALANGSALWIIPTAGQPTLTAQTGSYDATLRNAVAAGTAVLLVRNQAGALVGPLSDQFRAANTAAALAAATTEGLNLKASTADLAAQVQKGRANSIAVQMGALAATASVSGTTWTLSWSGLRAQIDNIAVSIENLASTALASAQAIWITPTAGETTLTAQVGSYDSTLRNALVAGTAVLLVRNQSGALTGPMADQFRAAEQAASGAAKGRANAVATQLGALSVTASVTAGTWTLSWTGLRMQIDNIAVAVENLAETMLETPQAIWITPTAGETTLTAQVGAYDATLRNALVAGTAVLLVRNQSGALTGPMADQFRQAELAAGLPQFTDAPVAYSISGNDVTMRWSNGGRDYAMVFGPNGRNSLPNVKSVLVGPVGGTLSAMWAGNTDWLPPISLLVDEDGDGSGQITTGGNHEGDEGELTARNVYYEVIVDGVRAPLTDRSGYAHSVAFRVVNELFAGNTISLERYALRQNILVEVTPQGVEVTRDNVALEPLEIILDYGLTCSVNHFSSGEMMMLGGEQSGPGWVAYDNLADSGPSSEYPDAWAVMLRTATEMFVLWLDRSYGAGVGSNVAAIEPHLHGPPSGSSNKFYASIVRGTPLTLAAGEHYSCRSGWSWGGRDVEAPGHEAVFTVRREGRPRTVFVRDSMSWIEM